MVMNINGKVNINEKMREISSRIRELRDILDMTATEVAAMSGIDEKTYDEYENGEKEVTVSDLYKIATVFQIDPTAILTGETPKMAGYTVVRKGNGTSVTRHKGYTFSSLATHYAGRDMEPMIVDLKKDGQQVDIVQHPGQEFNLVLKGCVQVNVGGKTFDLNEGDSIYFNSGIKHSQSALTDKAAFLAVINEISADKKA
jgi:transcriptional regulator with XRE-family HTH domain